MSKAHKIRVHKGDIEGHIVEHIVEGPAEEKEGRSDIPQKHDKGDRLMAEQRHA